MQLVCALVIDAWYRLASPVAADAPYLTLMLWKVVNEWSVRDKALCSAYYRKVDLHTWYLPPRYIPLALFLNLVGDETKKTMATTVLKYPKTDFRIDKPELHNHMKRALCKDSSITNLGYFWSTCNWTWTNVFTNRFSSILETRFFFSANQPVSFKIKSNQWWSWAFSSI